MRSLDFILGVMRSLQRVLSKGVTRSDGSLLAQSGHCAENRL